MEIKSPYKVIKVLFQRKYKGYLYRRELVDDSDYGGDGNLPMICCYSLDKGDYIGNAKTARYLAYKMGITKFRKTHKDHSVCSIGFNIEEQKWYGWSHRAIYGFGIGSTCKKGDCGYTPSSVDELYDEVTIPDEEGYAWQKPENVKKVKDGIEIYHKMVDIVGENPDGSLQTKESDEPSIQHIKIGKGEWTAKTLEDAKQMAIDFSSGVS